MSSPKTCPDFTAVKSYGNTIPALCSKTPVCQGQDSQPSSKGQLGVGFQLQGPGEEAGPKMPPFVSQCTKSAARELAPQQLLRTSQGQSSCRGHMGLWCLWQRGVASAWQGWRGKEAGKQGLQGFWGGFIPDSSVEADLGLGSHLVSVPFAMSWVHQIICLPIEDHLG